MTNQDIGGMVDKVERLVELYDLLSPPITRQAWLGISKAEDKRLTHGIYPHAIKPHLAAETLLKHHVGKHPT